jgi:PQQ-dependent catabolism-associated CXXCW motif protein
VSRVLVLGLWLIAFAVSAWSQNAIPEPTGYRMQDYRGPTPMSLAGARVVATWEVEELWKVGAAFVDVLPHPPRPTNLPPGTIWHEKPRMNIPGSIWLPDTGYGALAISTERYLRNGLARITQGDQSRWLVVYCQKDCWMSWNAAKRALTMGYKNVAWYPDGTDGWEASGLPVQQAEPAPPADTE